MATLEDVKEKIRALSLKTVANGATAAEEATARDMIRRLAEKYDVKVEKPHVSNQGTNISRKHDTSPFEEDPLKGQSLKNFVKSKIVDVDWDSVAKHRLTNSLDYYDYLNETHPWWERREKTKRGLVRTTDVENYVTEADYRIKCFETFTQIYEERK